MAAKKAILDSAERIVGAPVRDAVVIVQRQPWSSAAIAVGAVVGVVTGRVLNFDPLLSGAVAGGLAGVGLAASTTYRFLVRTEHQLVLTSSSRWFPRPTKLLRPIDPGMVGIQGTGFKRELWADGDAYRFTRGVGDRIRAMLADLQGPPPPNVPPGYVPYQS